MPYEYSERSTKASMIVYRLPNKQLKYSGMVRLSFADGTSTLRLTAAIDNAQAFDTIEIIEPQYGDSTEIALTHFDANYGVHIA